MSRYASVKGTLVQKSNFLAVVLLALGYAPGTALAGTNVIKSLDVSGDDQAARVVMAGNQSPTFTVFRLTDPSRVVVDVSGADVSSVRGPRDGKGPITGLTVSQFADDRTTVGRLVIGVAEEAAYNVRADGNNVLVTIGAANAPGASVSTANVANGANAVTAVANATVNTNHDSLPAATPADAQEARAVETKASSRPESSLSEPDVVTSRRDERVVDRPGHRLLGVNLAKKGSSYLVDFLADGEVGTFDVVELSNPPRLALDLFGFDRGLKQRQLDRSAPLREMRFGKHPGKIRVVLQARDAEHMPSYQVVRRQGGLQVALSGDTNQVSPGSTTVLAAKPAPAKELAKEKSAVPTGFAYKKQGPPANVRNVAFQANDQGGQVVISVRQGIDYHVTRPDPHTAVLTLYGASLPKHLERSLDTSTYGGPVKMVSSFAAPGQAQTVQVVATLEGSESTTDTVAFQSGRLTWEFKSQKQISRVASSSSEMFIDGQRVELKNEAKEESAVAPRTGGFVTEAPNYAAAASPRRAKYVGRRVSFEFKDIDIHNLLRIIAEVSKRNIIVADNVSGKVTVRLRNVPWDQALELILRSKALGKEEFGNIIRVAPLKDLEEEHKIAENIAKSRRAQEPLKVRLIPVNYATAADLSTKVKDLLSERGTMSVDTRTNVIVVKDTADALARAEGLVRRLDTQTPQVLIESRIVEANNSFSREVGIQWGGNMSMGPSTGNPTGLAFPSVVRMTGASSADTSNGTSDVPNFAVNLPAPVSAGTGGAMGFVFGSAGGAVTLNLRLSAMEATGQIKTISAPRVTTLDNTAAIISQGVAIPFSQYSSAGVNTMFVEAKLELKVTPHVASDGNVLMTIHATNAAPDPSFTGSNGQPSINKKEAQTQVLVKDGDTTVIGGIYTREQSTTYASVPWLSKIPVLGWMFKKRGEKDNRTELLIFITPRIVNRNQALASGESTGP